jgi:hypothetical protein
MLSGEPVSVNVLLYETQCHQESTFKYYSRCLYVVTPSISKVGPAKYYVYWKSISIEGEGKIFSIHWYTSNRF